MSAHMSHAVMRSLHAVMRCLHAVMRSLHAIMRSLHTVMRCLHAVMRCLHAYSANLPSMMMCFLLLDVGGAAVSRVTGGWRTSNEGKIIDRSCIRSRAGPMNLLYHFKQII